MNKLTPVSEVVEECKVCVVKVDDLDLSCLRETLTQHDQELLKAIEGMHKIYDIHDRPHVPLEAITNLIKKTNMNTQKI